MSSSSSALRTNSLAFAKTDCHTCAAHQRQCDRKRPRCSTCSGRKILCGGYPMQLTWPKNKPSKPKADSSMNRGGDPFYIEPLSLQTSNHVQNRSSRSLYQSYRKLAFVAEKSPDLKQKYASSSNIRKRKKSASPCEVQPQSPAQSSPFSRANPDEPSFHIPNQLNLSRIDYAVHKKTNSSSEDHNDRGTIDMSSTAENHVDPMFIDPRLLFALRTPVLYEDLFGKYEQLLNMYDQEFCIIPLSGDILSNPLRCRIETCHESQSLLHAILAVSGYHSGRRGNKNGVSAADVNDHHNTAVNLYRKELDAYADLPQGVRLFDTTMILLLFRATQSALSDWTTQIFNARKLLKLCGGPGFWANNRRTQAQIVLLMWWDANIALLSRQGCILPCSYFESLLAVENDKYWSFFDLVGCPRELVVHLMQLTSLAQENEQALSMRWTNDLTLVNDIQASIGSWKNSSILTIDNDLCEESMQQQRDRYHCTEAWRYGLLIYIARVFQWNRKSSPPKALVIYARLIFEHVQSCRRTSIVAKQAFFPLFLAGCETKDQFLRQSIREFCEYWDTASGYNLFRSALSLLQDIWREQDGPSGDEVWWGSILDNKQQIYQLQGIQMQFCFG